MYYKDITFTKDFLTSRIGMEVVAKQTFFSGNIAFAQNNYRVNYTNIKLIKMAKKYYDQLTLFTLEIIILGTAVFDNVLQLLFSMNKF